MKPVNTLTGTEQRILRAIVDLPTYSIMDDDIHALLTKIGYTELDDCLKALEALNSLVEKEYVYIQESHWTEKSRYRGRSAAYYVGTASAMHYRMVLPK